MSAHRYVHPYRPRNLLWIITRSTPATFHVIGGGWARLCVPSDLQCSQSIFPGVILVYNQTPPIKSPPARGGSFITSPLFYFTMSVSLTPSHSLGFDRPLTVRKRTLTNNNAQPVMFKVKTTAQKLYRVHPNSGRIEPGKSVDVFMLLQTTTEEKRPISTKCEDMFLIQSALVTPDKRVASSRNIRSVSDGCERSAIQQQILQVLYLSPEGQVAEGEGESVAEQNLFSQKHSLSDPSKNIVSLSPSNSIGFKRPLTKPVKSTVTITNNSAQAAAFKVKSTSPQFYTVSPNLGRIEPGTSVDVIVTLLAKAEEPPVSAFCKDKFLIQSTIVSPDKEDIPLRDIWKISGDDERPRVHQQKIRVMRLPTRSL